MYYHIHGRAKVSQAKRDRTVLPNCVGTVIVLIMAIDPDPAFQWRTG
jgi:hypothetical protein